LKSVDADKQLCSKCDARIHLVYTESQLTVPRIQKFVWELQGELDAMMKQVIFDDASDEC